MFDTDTIPHPIYILIRDGCPFSPVPSTFAPANTHANVFFVLLPVDICKECFTLFRPIVTLRGITLPMSYNVYGPFREHLGRPKIAHGSHNDVRRLCWPNLGCESPLAETPKGSVCWEKKVAPSRFRCGQAIAVNRGKQR